MRSRICEGAGISSCLLRLAYPGALGSHLLLWQPWGVRIPLPLPPPLLGGQWDRKGAALQPDGKNEIYSAATRVPEYRGCI